MGKKQEKKQFQRLRRDSGQHRRILISAAVLGVIAFVPVSFRLYDLMVSRYQQYADLALENQTRITQTTARRGVIYDANMNILAADETVENVYLDPHELKQSKADLDTVAQTLGQILELDSQWIREQAQDITKRYKQIAARVDKQLASRIREFIQQSNISGIHLEPSSQRYYPYGTLASQVLGFTDASNVGAEGLEAAYNSYLQGGIGQVITTKGNNEMDMPFSYENFVNSQAGCSMILTLDATVQACLEKQMQNAIHRYDVQNGAFGIVMNVNTGQILAMATLGGYDPNDYQQIYDPQELEKLEQMRLKYLQNPIDTQAYQSGKQAYQEALTAARLKQWRNRCISDGYEPGSTFKVMTMAAALDCGAITLDTAFHCSGSEQIPGRSQRLHCWRAAGHGSEQTPQALQNSCNIAFAHIALKLGGERFYEYVEKFGILEKTGIDLAGESKGVFFDKALITNTEKWGTASLTSGSFGQTFKLTPLQLVRGIAAVVNGGYLVEPYIVEEILDDQGNTVLRQEPTILRQVISQDTSDTMCQLLRSVVTEGTAKNAAVAGYDIGGKTGTSEKIGVLDVNGNQTLDKIVSFVGVAPMDDPEYIVLIALDTPSRDTGIYISGGVMAAPTVGAVLEDILPYLGVEQTFLEEDAALRTLVMEDFVGMSLAEAQKVLKQKGLTVQVEGTQTHVTAQNPAPGQTIPGNGEVLLYCGVQAQQRMVTVPDFSGMNRQQANDAAGALGLYILAAGNPEAAHHIVVTNQSEIQGSQVPVGTTIRLEFTDTQAVD